MPTSIKMYGSDVFFTNIVSPFETGTQYLFCNVLSVFDVDIFSWTNEVSTHNGYPQITHYSLHKLTTLMQSRDYIITL